MGGNGQFGGSTHAARNPCNQEPDEREGWTYREEEGSPDPHIQPPIDTHPDTTSETQARWPSERLWADT
ncbi:unnamed protein product, partial [Clonostachys byssicola]